MNPPQTIFTDITFRFPRKHLHQKLRIVDHPDLRLEFDALLDEAIRIAKPKIVYRPLEIERVGDGFIMLQGFELPSTILSSKYLAKRSIYVFAATCGEELEAWASTLDDPLKQYWGHEILSIALERATRHLKREIIARYNPSHLTIIDPGATADWPLEGQTLLFDLLGDLPEKIGLSLLASHIMKPTKSVSGIMFEATETINRCRLCNMDGCFERGRPFDPSLFPSLAKQ